MNAELGTKMPSVNCSGTQRFLVCVKACFPPGVPSSNCSAKLPNFTCLPLENNCYCYLSWNGLDYNMQNFLFSNSTSDSSKVKENRDN